MRLNEQSSYRHKDSRQTGLEMYFLGKQWESFEAKCLGAGTECLRQPWCLQSQGIQLSRKSSQPPVLRFPRSGIGFVGALVEELCETMQGSDLWGHKLPSS